MWTGVQFTGTVAANATQKWVTSNWNPAQHVVWYVVPTTPVAASQQVEWSVEVARAGAGAVTYWISVKNLTASAVTLEGRFAVLN
ncbi:MAG TPA: hypothetical protein VF006_01460 [Longimicrobium sp.]